MLFARRPEAVMQWLVSVGLSGRYAVADFDAFGMNDKFDAIVNFVGVGNPAQAVAMGAEIFDITLKYDGLALGYIQQHSDCRYLFLSSGAAYGSAFDAPVDKNTHATVAINHLQPQDWYGVAKLHAECRHRSLPHLPIIDVRVFNYFSRSQNMTARFFITDLVRSIQSKETLITTSDNIVRDYLHPADFHQLISVLLCAPIANIAIDCYSKSPITKMALLELSKNCFGLDFEINNTNIVNATGLKLNYYSCNHLADDFGYSPSRSSAEGIEEEILAILKAA
jgi:nucleoside-diphosphate-sugar epimerase